MTDELGMEVGKALDNIERKSRDSRTRKLVREAWGPEIEQYYLMGMALGYEMALADLRTGEIDMNGRKTS